MNDTQETDRAIIDRTNGLDPTTLTDAQRKSAADARLREAERLESSHDKSPGKGEI